MNYSNSQRAGVILYPTALIFGAYVKADSEQKYYVRTTSFDARGTIYVHSRKLDETVSSTELDLRSGSVNSLKSAYYTSYAPYNAYYYLKARFGASADGNHLTVTGRYTP